MSENLAMTILVTRFGLGAITAPVPCIRPILPALPHPIENRALIFAQSTTPMCSQVLDIEGWLEYSYTYLKRFLSNSNSSDNLNFRVAPTSPTARARFFFAQFTIPI